MRKIDSTPLAMMLCSVPDPPAAFGTGSGIRRGHRRGGAFGASPAIQALGRGGGRKVDGMQRILGGMSEWDKRRVNKE